MGPQEAGSRRTRPAGGAGPPPGRLQRRGDAVSARYGSRQRARVGSSSCRKSRGKAVKREVWREEGVAGLYKGCAITCARAVPSHAAIFYLYEVASQQLAKY